MQYKKIAFYSEGLVLISTKMGDLKNGKGDNRRRRL
jgi:hypothetical protein